jgi:hypothetical protein
MEEEPEVQEAPDWTECIANLHTLYIGDVGDQVFCLECRIIWWEKSDYVRGNYVEVLLP